MMMVISIVLTLAMTVAGVAYAQDIIAFDQEDDELEAYGTIEEFETEYLLVDGVRYELTMDTEFEEGIEVGDWVKVKYFIEDDLNIAIEVELEDPDEEDDDDMDDDSMEDSAVCSGELIHPALEDLAMEYDVDYEELVTYFCDYHLGVGEIKLALETAEDEALDMSWDQILEMRLGGDEDEKKDFGWGQIWQELGLIGQGKPDKEDAEPQGLSNKNKEKNEFNEQFVNQGKEDKVKQNNSNKDKNKNKP